MDLSSLEKSKIVFLVLFCLLAFPALADNISTYRASVSLEDSNAFHNITIQFTQKISSFNYSILSEAENIAVKDAFGNDLNCQINKEGITSKVACSSLDVQTVFVSYNSKDSIKPSDSKFLFTADYTMPAAVDSFILEVKMPKSFSLVENGEFPSCSPDCLRASDGVRIVLVWNRRSLGQGTNIHVSAFFENASIIGGIQPWVLALTIIVILGGSITFFIIYRKKLPARFILPVLKDDEKRVWEAITKHGNGVNQKIVVRESNYSKSKVSKVLKSLQERGLVKLERMGRTNKVYLAGKSMKKQEKSSGNNQQAL